MMLIEKGTLGSYGTVILKNPATGDALYILPGLGGILYKAVLSAKNRLITVINTDEATLKDGTNSYYHSCILAPWPSRLRGGAYTHEGKRYQLTTNESGRNTAIHGLVSHAVFKVIKLSQDTTRAEVTLRHDYAGSQLGYPFPFRLEVVYALTADGEVIVSKTIQNTGFSTIPVALGWHPYFRLGSLEDSTLSFHPRLKILLDEHLLPYGSTPFSEKEIVLNNRTFDDIFRLDDSEADIILNNTKEGIGLYLRPERGEGKHEFLVIFTLPDRSAIAIEPLTANGDSFNNKDGLIQLPVAEKHAVSCTFWIG